MLRLRGLIASLGVLGVYLAVSPAADAQKKPAPQPTVVTLHAKIPTFAPMPETPELQQKGGLKLSLAPLSYKVVDDSKKVMEPVNPGWKEAFAPHDKDDVFVLLSVTPALGIEPARLAFRLHISNQMSRVFRGSGIAVQFNVAGKVVAINSDGYGELVNAIVPPRGEQDVLIVGPTVDTVPDPTTVGVFLYDVVTKTDAAGNVLDKQNVEWYFSYRCQTIDKELTVPPPQRMWVHPSR
jgi:hypothetical protein